MAYGFEVFDAEGEITASGVISFRLVEAVTVTSSSSFSQAVSVSQYEFDNDVVMLFSPDGAPYALQDYTTTTPTLTVSGTTATVTGGGIPGTAYVGVT